MGIFDSLSCWIAWLATTVKSYGIDAVELVITALISAANVFLALLPTFAIDNPQLDTGVVGLLNYVVNVNAILGWFGVLMGCWILYRLYQWALKWAKAAD
jgi:hypothetical protein